MSKGASQFSIEQDDLLCGYDYDGSKRNYKMNKTWTDLSIAIIDYLICQKQRPVLYPYLGLVGTIQPHSDRLMTQDAFHRRRDINLSSLGSSLLRKSIFPCTHVFAGISFHILSIMS